MRMSLSFHPRRIHATGPIFDAYVLVKCSVAFSPIIVSYTVEILPYSIRAKGFNVFNFTISLALIFNQYVNPIALNKLGWKYYVCFIPSYPRVPFANLI